MKTIILEITVEEKYINNVKENIDEYIESCPYFIETEWKE